GVAQGQSNCLVSSGSGVQILPPAPVFLAVFDEALSHAGRFGEVPKWPKGADCKSAGVRLRGFKSSPPHHAIGCGRAGAERGCAETDGRDPATRGGVAGGAPVASSRE